MLLKKIIVFFVEKKLNIQTEKQETTFDINFLEGRVKLELFELETELSNFNIDSLKGTIVIPTLKIEGSTNKIYIDIPDIYISLEEISQNSNNNIDKPDNYNIVQHDNISDTLYWFQNWIERLLKIIEIKNNKLEIKYNNEYNIKYTLIHNNFTFNIDTINFTNKQFDINFSNQNIITINNINAVISRDAISLDILWISVNIDPIIIIFIQKIYKSSFNNNSNNHNIDYNIVIDNISLLIFDIYCHMFNISFSNNTLKIIKMSCYDLDELYIDMNNLIYSPNKFIINTIELSISKKINSIFSKIESFLIKYEEEEEGEGQNIENIEMNNVIENYNSNELNTNTDNQFVVIDRDIYTEKIIDNIFKLNKFTIVIKDTSLIAKITFEYIKIINYQDSSKYFRIRDVFMRDLTDKKWDYILYKNGMGNIFEVRLNLNKKCVQNGNSNIYTIYIKPSDISLNIDEYCIKLCLPLLTGFLEIVDKLVSYFPNNPIYIQECVFIKNTLIISYRPRSVDLKKIINGNPSELINLGTIHDLKIHFKTIQLRNIFGYGELIENLLIHWQETIKKNAIFILLQNQNIKYFFSPFTRLKDLQQENLKQYIQGISLDILEIAEKITKKLKSGFTKNKKNNLLQKVFIELQYLVDNNKKIIYEKKYKK